MDENIVNKVNDYYCSGCGKEVKTNNKVCPHCGATIEEPIKIAPDSELNRLNDFSKEVYYKIIARHPEWEKYAKVEKYSGKYLKEWLTFEIPSPETGIFPIEITTIEDVEEEITIYFGPAHRHLRWRVPDSRHSLDGQIMTLEEIVQNIFDEELVAIQKKPGIFFVSEGLATQDEYKILLDKGKLRRAVSWKGTFNYPDDGTHANWNP